MAVVRRCVSLLLILVSSVPSVRCQKVNATKVSDTGVELAWLREAEWASQLQFTVTITPKTSPPCLRTVYCFSADCTFKSRQQCSLLLACDELTVEVSSGGYTAPKLTLQTAPEPVTDLKVDVGFGGVEAEVTWTPPSSSSSCYVGTVVHVTYGGYIDITHESPDGDKLIVPLCMLGSGEVKVWTEGGDGESSVTSKSIVKILGSNAVTNRTCEAMECDSLNVAWKYNPVCPNITHFSVSWGNFSQSSNDTSTTSLTLTGLPVDEEQDTCIEGLGEDEVVLARTCGKCYGPLEVVVDLVMEALNTTAVHISWGPPQCPAGPNPVYMIYVQGGAALPSITTSKTSSLMTGLSAQSKYTICVATQYPSQAQTRSANCQVVYTLPSVPNELQARQWGENALYVNWKAPLMSVNHYNVTWGDSLEYSNTTEHKSYTIDDYDPKEGVGQVCVQTMFSTPNGLVQSLPTCLEEPYPPFEKDMKGEYVAVIASVCASAGIAVLLSAGLVLLGLKGRRS